MTVYFHDKHLSMTRMLAKNIMIIILFKPQCVSYNGGYNIVKPQRDSKTLVQIYIF